jgi:hypothetical protein
MMPFNTKSKVPVWDIIARDGWFCSYCGDAISAEDMTVDHVTPTTRGGADTLSNVVVCCRWCNSEKGDMTLEEYRHWRACCRYVFDIAPREIFEYGAVQITIKKSSFVSTIAPIALWMGTDTIDNDFKATIESGGAIVVGLTRGTDKGDVVFMSGPLYEYYKMKRDE